MIRLPFLVDSPSTTTHAIMFLLFLVSVQYNRVYLIFQVLTTA